MLPEKLSCYYIIYPTHFRGRFQRKGASWGEGIGMVRGVHSLCRLCRFSTIGYRAPQIPGVGVDVRTVLGGGKALFVGLVRQCFRGSAFEAVLEQVVAEYIRSTVYKRPKAIPVPTTLTLSSIRSGYCRTHIRDTEIKPCLDLLAPFTPSLRHCSAISTPDQAAFPHIQSWSNVCLNLISDRTKLG